MTYSVAGLSTISPRKTSEKSLVELIQDTAQVTLLAANSLVDLVEAKKRKQDADRRAHLAMKQVIKMMTPEEADEKNEDSTLGKWLIKIMKFVGKKIFKYIARPILNFAARVAMNLVRIVLRSVVSFVIEPLIELVVGFALANPITAAILGVAALGGLGYWMWSKFFKESASPPAVNTANVAKQAEDIAGPAVMPAPVPEVEVSKPKTIIDYIEAPVKYAKEKIMGKQFKGFGEDVDSYISEASSRFGLPVDVLRGFVKMEAGWNGQMSPTGAIGTGQFIQPTWDALALTPEGEAIGMTKIGKRFRTPQGPRFDKRINTLATALLAKNNAAILAKNNLPITGENLYMLHNIGPGIIAVMLGYPASPEVLKAMRQNGMLSGQSASDFLKYQKGRFGEQYAIANTQTLVAGEKPKLAAGVTLDKKQVAVLAATSNTSASNGATSTTHDRDIIQGPGKTLLEVNHG